MTTSRAVSALLAFIAVLFPGAHAVHAFDTGHHADLTQSVLSERGFDARTVGVVQAMNWFTDYYALMPIRLSAAQRQRADELKKLHFDNLYTTRNVTSYWRHLTRNLARATLRAAQNQNEMDMLAILGMGLHAVQDFYTHSNWVETHPRAPGGPFRSETWWNSGPPANAAITTGNSKSGPSPASVPPAGLPEHGGYFSGLNKDSHMRPKWAEAYVFAYCASHELAAAMQSWSDAVRPGFWQKIQKLKLSAADTRSLSHDLWATYRISLLTKDLGKHNGHWKGNDSGDRSQLLRASARWLLRHSNFVQYFKNRRIYRELTPDLYSLNAPPARIAIPRVALNRRVILLRVTEIAEKNDVGLLESQIDPNGKADFYAHFTFGNQTYIDRTLIDRSSYQNPWAAIHFVDAATADASVKIEVYDSDNFLRGSDDTCDINPNAAKTWLDLRLNRNGQVTGDANGVFNRANVLTSSGGGDKDRAVIKLFFEQAPVAP